MEAFDPEAAQALRKVYDMSGQDLSALLEVEGLPSTTTREAYVQQAVQRICVAEVEWQSASFAEV